MQASARNIIPSVSEADLFNERDSEVTPAQEALDAETEFKTIPVRAKRPKLTKEKLTPHFDKLRDFKFLPFGGRGHEASDMRMLMREYQKWAVMVEPNLTFNEFLNQCEKLTSAMRSILDPSYDHSMESAETSSPHQPLWEAKSSSNRTSSIKPGETPSESADTLFSDDAAGVPSLVADIAAELSSGSSQTQQSMPLSQDGQREMTEAQKQRMEENRLRALKLREQARLQRERLLRQAEQAEEEAMDEARQSVAKRASIEEQNDQATAQVAGVTETDSNEAATSETEPTFKNTKPSSTDGQPSL